jgi:hypothetical protein
MAHERSVTLLCVQESIRKDYPPILDRTQTTQEDSMKSLAYVFAALLTLAIVAPSVASAGDMHRHHHHYRHHH